jgi:CDP-diacylglycerol--glycerol-3-phosphate 3-phosphatidyltransferase
MKLADRITLSRIILAPVFFIVYMLPLWLPTQFEGSAIWVVPLLWIIAIVAEFTDMFDGMAARRLNQTSDFGRLFDPFADTLMQLTGFLCFVIDDIFPRAMFVVLFLVVLYREYGILFIRNLMLKKGIVMGARKSGKAKTVAYISAAGIALFYSSLVRLDVLVFLQPIVRIAAAAAFGISVLIAVISFFDYLSVYLKAGKASGDTR